MTSPRSVSRLRAPELTGRGWLNTGASRFPLADLRGRIVVLDFWTFCCVNCLHVLDELRPLEEKYADSLVLIGVHSPKFEHEADADALAAAVERMPCTTRCSTTPSSRPGRPTPRERGQPWSYIDPEGYIVASMSGEGHAHGLSVLIEELIAEHSARGRCAKAIRRMPRRRPPRLRCASRGRPLCWKMAR